jgi:hypothetical protein
VPTRDRFALYFEASIPPMGATAYFIQSDLDRTFESVKIEHDRATNPAEWLAVAMPGIVIGTRNSPPTISNGHLTVNFAHDGSLVSYHTVDEQKAQPLTQSYYEYPSDSNWANHYTFKSLSPPAKIDRFGGYRYEGAVQHTLTHTLSFCLLVCVCVSVCLPAFLSRSVSLVQRNRSLTQQTTHLLNVTTQ